MRAQPPVHSVIIPFYNEEGAIPGLLAEVRAVMDGLGTPYEGVFVDDGSTDGTAAVLAAATRDWPQARVIAGQGNQGQAAALLRGFEEARGRWLITLDGDGQNDPADIPALLQAAANCDMVVGIRATRRDSWLRRAMSSIANGVRGRILGDHLHDSGCALKVFRAEVARSFFPIRSLYSFMPAMAIAAGFRVTELPVSHRERRTGESKYGLGTFAWRPLVDTLALWWLLRHRPARRNRHG
jgi:glycosyltransferase involved in cell wall biosynthesis